MDNIRSIDYTDSIPEIAEENYITLERLDLTDIAQAIDGSRSKPIKSAEIDVDFNEEKWNFNNLYRTIKCWFW